MEKDIKVLLSEEYKQYIAALADCACYYVDRIRIQFAEKAYQNYFNETIKKLVIAYGEESEKLRKQRERDFYFAVEYYDDYIKEGREVSVKDSCINKEKAYREALLLLFDIQ